MVRGGGVQSHFHVKPNLGYVRLSCGWVGVLTISAMKFLLDDGQDDVDMEDFFPTEFSEQERRTRYSAEQGILLPNNIFTPN